MTTLTIELTPDLYERLQQEAQRQGKHAQTLVQELVEEQLPPQTEQTLPAIRVKIPPELEARLDAMNTTDLIIPPTGTPEDTIRLLQSWNEKDAAAEEEEGEGTWEDVLRAIDESRHSYRKLFPDLEKPQ